VKKAPELETLVDEILSKFPSFVSGELPKADTVYGFREVR
jgi:hypothetical protein